MRRPLLELLAMTIYFGVAALSGHFVHFVVSFAWDEPIAHWAGGIVVGAILVGFNVETLTEYFVKRFSEDEPTEKNL